MINLDQFKELSQRISAIEAYLKIGEKRIQLQEEELKSHDPDFLNVANACS
jgi:hypothetical protein